jgi:secretion/DNA translocation related CpaE-like protein
LSTPSAVRRLSTADRDPVDPAAAADEARDMSHTEDHVARPLVATADEALLDDLLRLAAAAGTTPEVIADAGSARRAWPTAGMVVVGDDLAPALASARPPRRDGVVVVGSADRDRPVDGPDGPDAVPFDGPTGVPTEPSTVSSVWAHAVAVGAEDVLRLPDREAELIDRFGACLDGARRALTIAVVGGSGGCGASTFAAALAVAGADRGLATLLIDADPLGGGLDLHLGADVDGMRWPDLATTSGRLAAPALREALPRVHGVSLLSWGAGEPRPLSPDSLRSVLTAGQRGHDLVIVDLPRRAEESATEALALADYTLLVVHGDVVGVAAARRVARPVRSLARRVGVVAIGGGSSSFSGDVVSELLDLPLLVGMRPDRRVAADLDDGLGPMRRRRGPLATGCRAILDELAVASTRAA